ncbi:MAG: hypothetical protein RKE49_02790 [Oceanicaulis sp.]
MTEQSPDIETAEEIEVTPETVEAAGAYLIKSGLLGVGDVTLGGRRAKSD